MNLHLQLITLLAVFNASANAAAKWAGMESLPNGPYEGFNLPNGSTIMKSLTTGTEYTFHLTNDTLSEEPLHRRSSNAIAKRNVDCWGYQLDVTGVDYAVTLLKRWAGSGIFLPSCRKTNYFGYNHRGVYVYYCINALHAQGNLNVDDINYALSNMDRTCRPYEASYFRWPGSPELVGKCASGTPVCLG